MIIREALKAKVSIPAKQNTIDLILTENGLVPEDEYNPADETARRNMDLSQAGLILWICTNPKSVKELDYQITQQDISDLLILRAGILKRWGVDYEFADEGPTIQIISDLW